MNKSLRTAGTVFAAVALSVALSSTAGAAMAQPQAPVMATHCLPDNVAWAGDPDDAPPPCPSREPAWKKAYKPQHEPVCRHTVRPSCPRFF